MIDTKQVVLLLSKFNIMVLQDFRLRHISEYEEWYGQAHRAPDLQVGDNVLITQTQTWCWELLIPKELLLLVKFGGQCEPFLIFYSLSPFSCLGSSNVWSKINLLPCECHYQKFSGTYIQVS